MSKYTSRLGAKWKDNSFVRRIITVVDEGPTPVICAYPLDPTELAGFGFGAPTMSNGDQTASIVLPSGTNLYGASPDGTAGGTGLTVDATAGQGVIVMQIKWDSLYLAQAGEGAPSSSFDLYNGGLAKQIGVTLYSTGNKYYLDALIAGPSLGFEVDLGTTKPNRTTLAIDTDNSQFTLYDESGNALGTAQSYTPQVLLPILVVEGNSIAGSATGSTVTSTWVTAASDMTGLPAITATDICGNAI